MNIRLFGCNISKQNARVLVSSLLADGHPDSLDAAEQISEGLTRHASSVALTPTMRDAILSVLAAPPNGLAGLQGALASDQRARQ